MAGKASTVREIRKGTKDLPIAGGVIRILSEQLDELRPGARVFLRALQRRERLRPLAVPPAVPEIPRAPSRPDHGHRVAGADPGTDADGQIVSEVAPGLVTGCA